MNPLFSYDKVIERAKEVFKVNKNKDLASVFGVTPQTLSNRKSTQSVPYLEIIQAAMAVGADVQYILTGKAATEKQGDNGKKPTVGYLDVKAADSNGKKPTVGYLDVKAADSNGKKPTVGYLKKGELYNSLFADPIHNTAESPADYLVLSDDERLLLDYYRNCEESVRIAIVEMARVSGRST